ncbi:MAG: WD40/YVTN/BNR-like repeat-containing protein [Isosphaeraceae bacterium]
MKFVTIRHSLICGLIALCSMVPRTRGADSPKAIHWEPLGLNGGGGMFAPAISPIDPRMMMVNCDMSGAYVTRDGGDHWTMIHQNQLRSSTRCRPAFHPSDARTIFAAQAGAGMKVSHDGGLFWKSIAGTPEDLCGEIAIDPGHPSRMLAGDRRSIVLSTDGGKSWSRCRGPHGETLAFHFDQASAAEHRVCFAASREGIWRSDDGGVLWSEKTSGLPWKEIRSFCGGSRSRDGRVILYCTISSKVEDGKFAGGVFRSTDRGETWQSAMGQGINMDVAAADQWAHGPIAQYLWVLTTNTQPDTVYALNTNTGVYPPHHTATFRSDDAGRSWRPTFFPDPRFPVCNVEADYITRADGQFYQGPAFGAAICATDPDRLIQVNERIHITIDGGKTWKCGNGRLAPSSACNGLVVTTTWNYYIDPFERSRHYIAYTDLGMARSLDGGRTWRWWDRKGRAPWQNTCYEMAFDPEVPGKTWGAFSNVHDIPNGNIIYGSHRDTYPGGICVSTDFGATWKPCSKGLPPAPAVSVVLDPRSPVRGRTLYASLFNHGVYRSTDGGTTWQLASGGLGSPEDMRVCRLQLHRDGSLFALVTAKLDAHRQFVKKGPGIYRSSDGAEHWKLVNASCPLFWPKDFLVDPRDSRTIYVGAADGRADQAGLWRTRDGDVNWRRLARKGPEHFGAYLHPAHKGWIYMTLTEGAPRSGLWLSKDDGQTWKPMSLPFANAQRVCFDRAHPDIIYVTTFGGSIWKGPASED